MTEQQLDDLARRIAGCPRAQAEALGRRLRGLRKRLEAGKPIDRGVQALGEELAAMEAQRAARSAVLPRPVYDDALPICQRRAEIAAAIAAHQVVVICGETGSGKTTQLPKICLELGFGVRGLIGHTQPRRIAARSVAARIAAELNTSLGEVVGYKVRFSDRIGAGTAIKLMTDGILLAETQGDRDLDRYEVLIIDEAHERSLNIDFLLGYLKQLLPRRPDLKVIITSATIDPQSFSRHFGGAPVIEVSGRAYPVEMRYRPLLAEDEEQRDRDQVQAILDAVDELAGGADGDILIFLAGEREIRETAEALRKHHPPATEILPLYARLSASEQNRVFQPHGRRRIVLATNVAETSLTVPGIRYVVDPGSARISRYSHRSRVQRLPVERVSQASADQRAGRCGRVSAGVCIRLYSEQDYQSRPRYTQPEILRTNLAAVILQMRSLGLGELEAFPLLDAPDSRLINDGYRLLRELGAVDADRQLTPLGRELSRLPVDPRLGRMLLAGRERGCLREVLVIVSALAVQDPRERPHEHRAAADQKHRLFRDERSDFLSLVRLWDAYHEQARHCTNSRLRAWCREHFLGYLRMREWHEVHQQLRAQMVEAGASVGDQPGDAAHLHQALLSGLLGHVGLRQQEGDYLGAHGRRFHVFPGSGQARGKARWIMAAELVETSRLYARCVARIDPEWIEPLAGDLLRRNYAEPHWERRGGRVTASETVTLFGLPIVVGRKVDFGRVSPAEARQIFIRRALVEGDFDTRAECVHHNRALIGEIEDLEARFRRRDLLIEEAGLYRFYDERLPAEVRDGPSFERWRRQAERKEPRCLYMTREQLLARDAVPSEADAYPDRLTLGPVTLEARYRFEPGSADDGVSVSLPIAALGQVDEVAAQWLVPGLLQERVAALLRGLPKALRRNFVPVPDFARGLCEAIGSPKGDLTTVLARHLQRMTGVSVPVEAWDEQSVPEHLRINYRIVDDEGGVIAEGRDLGALRARLGAQARASFAAETPASLEREQVEAWDFGDLDASVALDGASADLRGFPALVAGGGGVSLRVLDSAARAEREHADGVLALLATALGERYRYLRRNLPGWQTMALAYARVDSAEALREDLLWASLRRAAGGAAPRSQQAFDALVEQVRGGLVSAANGVCAAVAPALESHRALRVSLSGGLPLAWAETAADLRTQLDGLIHKGFLRNTPDASIDHLPRYLRGAQLRWEKLARQPQRDRERARELAPLLARYRDLQRSAADHAALEEVRWMLEELRVSLFAQELRTPAPVSAKRVAQALDQIRR